MIYHSTRQELVAFGEERDYGIVAFRYSKGEKNLTSMYLVFVTGWMN